MDRPINGAQHIHNATGVGGGDMNPQQAGNAIETAAGVLAQSVLANTPAAVNTMAAAAGLPTDKFGQAITVVLHQAFNSADENLTILNQFDVVLAPYSGLAAFNRATRLASIDLLPIPEQLLGQIRLTTNNCPVAQRQVARQLLARLIACLIDPVGTRITQGDDVDVRDIEKTASTALALLKILNIASPGEPIITHTNLTIDQLTLLCRVFDGAAQFLPAQHPLAAQAAQFLSHLNNKINFINSENPDADHIPPNFLADYDVMMALVTRDGSVLEFASRALQHDRNIVRAAVRNNGLALDFAAEALQDDREIVWAAVTSNNASEPILGAGMWQALQFASPALRADQGLVLAAVSNEGVSLEAADPLLQDDYNVVMTAVMNDGLALEFASPRLQADYSVVRAAVEQDESALRFANPLFRNYTDFWFAEE